MKTHTLTYPNALRSGNLHAGIAIREKSTKFNLSKDTLV